MTKEITFLMDPDRFWKEREIETTLKEPIFQMSNSEIFQKHHLITSIYRLGETKDHPGNPHLGQKDNMPENILFIDDLNIEMADISFDGNIHHFIRLVVNSGAKAATRKFSFSKSVVITELNCSPNKSYSTCQYHCKEEAKIFIFEKNRDSITKQNTLVCLDTPHSKVDVQIAVETQPGQKRDDFIEFHHSSPETYSNVKYLSLNGGIATSQANSLLDKNSKQCESYQNLKHILLNEKAKSYAKPNLMILNPDVMAQHGNNFGAINDDDISYLLLRGISPERGKEIIQKSLMDGAIELHPEATFIKEFFYEQ